MLTALSIQNIILIDRLNLAFAHGLSVLTGETGAGKSILLDAFALALGGRGDAGLVRQGEAEGQVTASFDLPADHRVQKILDEHALADEGTVILRRIQLADGRTKAFINDRPVNVQLLRQVGNLLVEIHGQHDERALVDPSSHRKLLDAYGGLEKERSLTRISWQNWRAAKKALKEHEELLAKAREETDFLTAALDELRQLDPLENEEEQLAGHRQVMMHAEKIAGDLQGALNALTGDRAQSGKLSAALRKLERQEAAIAPIVDPAARALERVLLEMNEARGVIEDALRKTAFEPSDLETTEERLFALRAASRKFNVAVVSLPGLVEKIENELAAIHTGEEKLNELTEASKAAGEAYESAALILSKKRKVAAKKLDKAVMAELTPLKLERAEFLTHIESVPTEEGGEEGIDRVAFWVKTNPGTQAGPIMKVASGGELSRFILALKVVLAARGSAPILIFDEIDTGVGGAVASSIGERLARLAKGVQVLTITHAPQVAALADLHMQIAKEARNSKSGESMVTKVAALEKGERLEEIARMLAGAKVTDEARAAAKQLIGGRG